MSNLSVILVVCFCALRVTSGLPFADSGIINSYIRDASGNVLTQSASQGDKLIEATEPFSFDTPVFQDEEVQHAQQQEYKPLNIPQKKPQSQSVTVQESAKPLNAEAQVSVSAPDEMDVAALMNQNQALANQYQSMPANQMSSFVNMVQDPLFKQFIQQFERQRQQILGSLGIPDISLLSNPSAMLNQQAISPELLNQMQLVVDENIDEGNRKGSYKKYVSNPDPNTKMQVETGHVVMTSDGAHAAAGAGQGKRGTGRGTGQGFGYGGSFGGGLLPTQMQITLPRLGLSY